MNELQCNKECSAEIERLRETMRLMYAHYHNDDGPALVAVYEKEMRNSKEKK